MSYVLIICAALSLQIGTCGHVRRDFFPTLEACNEQRDKVVEKAIVAYAYCRPVRPVDL